MHWLIVACWIAVFTQTAAPPASWTGTWILDVQKSTFGTSLVPGAPNGLKIVGQTVRIGQISGKLTLSADIVFSDSSGSHSVHEENSLSLDGAETLIGPVSLSFKRIDNSTFDIISKLNTGGGNVLAEVSHFVVTSDGMTLTETKTQTERTPTGAVMRTSTFVLIFSRLPEH